MVGVGRGRARRRGTTTVEAALVLPVFLVFVFAIIEIGHANMVKHLMRSACRQAARHGATTGVSTQDTIERALSVLGTGINANAATVIVRDASVYDNGDELPESADDFNGLPSIELGSAPARQLFVVRAQVAYNDVALLSLPWMDGVVIAAEAFMRHE